MDKHNEKTRNTNNTDDNTDKNYPGYPHYPASEDITRAGNNTGKISLEETSLTGTDPVNTSNNESGPAVDLTIPDDTTDDGASDADVTEEDIQILDAAENNVDTIDDENLHATLLDEVDDDGDELNEPGNSKTLTGEELDIPGSGLDDDDENIGEEDEENNYYSLGGDNHENQEENKGE